MAKLSENKLLMLKPEEIFMTEDPLNRKDDETDLRMLAISIKSNGIIEPLAVRLDEQGRYQLVTGYRRLRAAFLAGLRRVPCVLYKIDKPTAALYCALGNIQSRSPYFLHEYRLISDLIYKFGFSYSEVSARLGIPQSEIASKIGLLKLDSRLQEKITEFSLSEEYAKSLLKLPGSMRDDALEIIISEKMTALQADQYIHKRLHPPAEVITHKPQPKIAIGDIRIFSNSLTKLVMTLQTAGVNAAMRKYETDRYYEFKIKITKETSPVITAEQLKIC